MNYENVGIGILDLYEQNCLDDCINSLSFFNKNNISIASLTNNKVNLENFKKYSTQTPLATLRNYLISQFRIKKLKYYFLIHSNQVIKNNNIINDTIDLASTFGCWFLTGYDKKYIALEDDSGKSLNISNKLNTDFLFILNGIIKNNGFFDERYFNGKDLDVIDFLIKLKNKKVYPPSGYYPTIDSDWIQSNKVKPTAIGYKDEVDHNDKALQLSYAYFYHNHKYIPNQNDPQPASNDELLAIMEELQKNYGKS
jgi:hypothetical protein